MSEKILRTVSINGEIYKLGGSDINIPLASVNEAGCIKVGSNYSNSINYTKTNPTGNNNYYAVNIDNSGKAFVEMPINSISLFDKDIDSARLQSQKIIKLDPDTSKDDNNNLLFDSSKRANIKLKYNTTYICDTPGTNITIIPSNIGDGETSAKCTLIINKPDSLKFGDYLTVDSSAIHGGEIFWSDGMPNINVDSEYDTYENVYYKIELETFDSSSINHVNNYFGTWNKYLK